MTQTDEARARASCSHFWSWDSCDGAFCKYVCMDCGETTETPCILDEDPGDRHG